ncbi:MAG: VOC family protein, partial [Chloroflexi bacterium]|nr:VOC family protein [Chloroflexota bacterium]
MGENGYKANIIPGMRYRDAHAAIEWLCEVLGFERRMVVPDGEGGVAHAELTLGGGMIMLGSDQGNADDFVVAPTPDGTLTQNAYIVVSEIEAAYERAKDAGANIVSELEEQHYGGSLFSVRDPEGQLWHLGS